MAARPTSVHGSSALSRRGFLFGAGGVAAAVALAGCGGTGAKTATSGGGGGDITLRAAWWGSQDRAKRTNKVFDLFTAKHSNVSITPESIADFDAYWQKIATQTAGGNPADLYMQNYRYFLQYASKDAMLDLSSVSKDKLDLSALDSTLSTQGVVDGKRYAVPLGLNTESLYINPATVGAKASDLPPDSWTWDDFADWCAELAPSLPKGAHVSDDQGGSDIVLEPWLLQRGIQFFTRDGKLGFGTDELMEWFDYWAKLRKTGALSPPDQQAQAPDTQRLAQRKLTLVWSYSNLMEADQSLTKDPLSIHTYPTGGPDAEPGHFIIGSGQMLCVSSKSDHGTEAAEIIGFIINDEGAIKALGIERGLPPTQKARDLLRPDLDEVSKTALAYFEKQSKNAAPDSIYYAAPPAGTSEVTALLSRTYQDVQFGKSTAKAAAATIVKQAKGILT